MSEEIVDMHTVVGNILEQAHPDQMREMLGSMLAQVMEAEVETVCNAGYGKRGSGRVNRRNGYRQRALETRVGSIELAIPKLRQGSYLPDFIEPRRRWERAFVNVVAEAYVHGVSTRKVEDLVEAMGAKGMSKSQVSRMAASLDAEVDSFRQRQLAVAFPYLWLDALYVRVRNNGRIVSKAVLVAIGVNENGEREVIGVDVADKEMESSWRKFLGGLVQRGLRGVQLAISDAHEGLQKAIPAVLNGVTWQRCYVHFIRNMLSHVPRHAQGLVSAAIRNIFHQPTEQLAREAVGRAIAATEQRYPKVAKLLGAAEYDVLAHFQFPAAHRRQIRSTNPLERLNKELRRRVRVVGIFPNDAAVIRLVGMLLVEQHEEWLVGRRYFSTRSMAALTDDEAAAANALEVADGAT